MCDFFSVGGGPGADPSCRWSAYAAQLPDSTKGLLVRSGIIRQSCISPMLTTPESLTIVLEKKKVLSRNEDRWGRTVARL